MKAAPIFSLVMLLALNCFAQGVNDIWIFGGLTGLSFNTATPTMISSSMSSLEGCASICNSSGELLFYSNGLTIWNREHKKMPNGDELLGSPQTNATQGVAIAPIVGFSNLYFLFTLDEYNQEKTGHLRYSLIDMNLDHGLGDVVTDKKNILLGKQMSEKMIIAPACNGVWLITHHIDSSVFYAYKINSPIEPMKPIISNTGGYNLTRYYYIGEMKLSHDERNLALCNWRMPIEETIYQPESRIELFDFNSINGEISNAKVIDSSNMAYSIEFSPDNSKLYYTEFGARLFQYDLSLLPDIHAVHSSKTRIGLNNEYKSMRTGPDNKLYLTNGNFETNIFRINEPNKKGNTCDLDTGLTFFHSTFRYISFGNNNVNPKTSPDSIIFSKTDTSICRGSKINSFSEETVVFDQKFRPVQSIDNEGLYFRGKFKDCKLYIDSLMIAFLKDDTLSVKSDSSICFADSIEMIIIPKATNHIWSDGDTSIRKVFHQPNDQKILYSFGNNCKVYNDTFFVTFTNYAIHIPDAEVCNDSFIIIDAQIPGVEQYKWSNGLKDPTIKITTPGLYSIEFSKNGCTLSEEFIVKNKYCNNCIILTNAFTPNSDGHNDYFKPQINCQIKSYSLVIMNRFGQKVFESRDPQEAWDGKFNQQQLNTGVYYYLIKVRFDQNYSSEQLFKGDITLIR